jgi:hypothetical protein
LRRKQAHATAQGFVLDQPRLHFFHDKAGQWATVDVWTVGVYETHQYQLVAGQLVQAVPDSVAIHYPAIGRHTQWRQLISAGGGRVKLDGTVTGGENL